MKINKKIKFALASLAIVPIVGFVCPIASCSGTKEDIGPAATKVTITNVSDQQEFDIQSTKKIELQAKVEPAEANQEVTYEILAQEGTGNIACSSEGIIYTNGCSGTITIKAWSKGKKMCSDPVELVFWDSSTVKFIDCFKEKTGEEYDYCLAMCDTNLYSTLTECAIPSSHKAKNTSGVEVTLPVVGISYGGFGGCEKLRYIHFPKKSEDFYCLNSFSFYQCNSLTNVTIPDSVTLLGDSAFEACALLETCTLGNNLQYILSSCFRKCISLENLILPESLEYIGPYAFNDCVNVKEFNIGPNVETIGEGAFADCWDSRINVDANNNDFKTDDNALFSKDGKRLLSCQHLTIEEDYTVPSTVEKIDSYAFCYCERIKKVIFSNSTCRSIGEEAFALCINLNYVKLPEYVNFTTLKDGLFSYCWNLNEIHIPANISTIERDVFYGCDSLNRAYFDGPTQWHLWNNSFDTPFNEDINLISGGSQDITKNARYLKTYGSYITNPETGEQVWTPGRYCNCVWTAAVN